MIALVRRGRRSSRIRAPQLPDGRQLAGHRAERRDRRRRRGRRDDGRADAEHRPQRRLDRRPQRRTSSADYARASPRRCRSVVVAGRDRGSGIVLGLVNGLLVAVGRIPAIIATLATLAIYRGIVVRDHCAATGITRLPAARSASCTSRRRSRSASDARVDRARRRAGRRRRPALDAVGRDFYAIGSNPDAARFAGIRGRTRVITAFALCGALAGLGGFMFASRFPNARRRRRATASNST